jgi:hypothetical protein
MPGLDDSVHAGHGDVAAVFASSDPPLHFENRLGDLHSVNLYTKNLKSLAQRVAARVTGQSF